MPTKEYYITNNSIENFKLLGFRHYGEGVYAYKFPVYFYNNKPTIFGIFIGNDENEIITINIIDENGNLYAPYYSDDKNNEVIKNIKSKIKLQLSKCNIVEKTIYHYE